jgi:hypothetical protein
MAIQAQRVLKVSLAQRERQGQQVRKEIREQRT